MVKTAPVKETALVGWSCGDVWLIEERVSAMEVNHIETAAEAAATRGSRAGARIPTAPARTNPIPASSAPDAVAGSPLSSRTGCAS